jgi:hypothetical protein
MELSMVQRRPALQVRRVDIRSCVDQNLDDRSVIRMRGRVQRRRAPVLIGVVRVHIAASLKQVCDGLKMPFPRRAVQCCGPVCIPHAEQAFVAREQSPKFARSPVFAALMNSFLGSAIESTPCSSVRVAAERLPLTCRTARVKIPPSAGARASATRCCHVQRRAMRLVCSSSQTKNHPQRGSILANDHK